MTTYTNDPVRCKLTLDDVWNMCHTKGIDAAYSPVPETNETEWYVKLVASDTNPHNPSEEKYIEDLDKEFERLHIVQDRIKSFEGHRPFNPNNSNKVIETILDEKVFSKENRYDVLLDKAREVHRLKDGRLFGTIEDA